MLSKQNLLALFFIFCSFLLQPSCSEVEITSHTYYCGPNGLCPKGLECQYDSQKNLSLDCTSPKPTNHFTCEAKEKVSLGQVRCGDSIINSKLGCVMNQNEDSIDFEIIQSCKEQSANLYVQIRFPVGAAPLYLELVDKSGKVLTNSNSCMPASSANNGIDTRCLEISTQEIQQAQYQIKVRLEQNSNADCNGTCAFNQFHTSLSYLIP